MTTISHVWPGYTLFNVWSLQFKDWAFLRASAQAWNNAQKQK